MKEVKRNKKFIAIIIAVIVLLVLSTTSFVLISNNKTKDINIDEVLETKEYSYLPKQAKNYIRQVYEETGEVLLTEKNKEENVPYLNPKFVEYLSLDEEEKNKEEIIPESTIIDYVYNSSVSSETGELPSKFDLRDVDGKNFVTPVKNQGGLGLCWAFATNAQAESYLLLKNNQTYTEAAQIFSERQIDYATSTNGIKSFDNKYGLRTLGSGGNFNTSIDVMKNALSLVDVSWKQYDDTDYEQMELYDVLNYKNSLYEVNSTINMPVLNITELDLTKEEDIEKRDSYINILKQNIMEYGGAYVGTGAPTYGCSVMNPSTREYLVYDNGKCNLGSHALQVIGWDDDYEYEFCAADKKNTTRHNNSITNCSEDRIVEGKGAWILKNSWGVVEDPNKYPYDHSYVYLAYDSMYSNFNFITNMSKSNEKTWNYSYVSYGDFISPNTTKEKIIKIKFLETTQNNNYEIGFMNNNGKLENIASIQTTLPGLYEIELSDDNVYMKDNIYLTAKREDGTYMVLKSYIYTISEVEEQNITTKDVTYKNTINTKNSDNYILHVYSDTENILTDEKIDYELYDSEGNNLSMHLSYEYNYVANNNVNSKLNISSEVAPGTYILKSKYNNEVKCESKIILRPIKQIGGSGTIEDPYVITTPDELAMIDDRMSSHFILGNDIDLTEATQNKDGIFYNNGKGWIPLGGMNFTSFDGSFDGKGYKIKGLYKEDSEYNGGLFYKVSPNNNYTIEIKNIVFEDCFISSRFTFAKDGVGTFSSSEGILAYEISDTKDNVYISSSVSLNIKNIAIKNSRVEAYNYTGALASILSSAKKDSISIENIFIDCEVLNSDIYFNNSKAGVIGFAAVQTNLEEDANLNIKNIMVMGSVGVDVSKLNDYTYNSSKNYYFSGVIGESKGPVSLSNVINISNFIKDNKYNKTLPYGTIVGLMNDSNKYYNGNILLKNIYYTLDEPIIGTFNEETNLSNVSRKTIKELTNSNLYINSENKWDNFDDDWKIETIDGIPRIPVLKFVDFEYTNISDIKLEIDKTVNLYDLITPNIELAKNITYEIKDNTIATVDEDGNIKGLKVGQTTIHVLSNYDGYEKDVPLIVTNKPGYIIEFNSNEEVAKTVTQFFELEEEKKLTKNTFEKEGYVFAGWNTKADGTGISYRDEEKISKLSDVNEDKITLYAQWIEEEFDIYFDPDGGTVSPTTKKVRAGQTYGELPIPIKQGSGFYCWMSKHVAYEGAEYGCVEAETKVSSYEEDRTLIAYWQTEAYTIVFDPNGGLGNTRFTFAYLGDDRTLSKNTYERENYTFVGWNTKADGTGTSYEDESKINLTEVENSLITLYAQWRVEKLELTFNSNNDSNETVVQNITFKENEKLIKNTFVNEGYIFKGWNTKANGFGYNYKDEEIVSKLKAPEPKLTLYAKWEAINYSVKFDSNTGIGEMDIKKLEYDVENALPRNIFTKEGYTFAGWNTKADGTGTSYVDKERVVNLTSVNNEVITLYAQWGPINYSIKFNSNTGTGTMENQSLTYDNESNLSKNTFVREGYIFKEWNTMPDETGTSYKDEARVKNLTVNEEEISLFAIWIPITYKVEFYGNGSVGTMEAQEFTYDVGESFLTKNTFTKEGYIFKEWNTKADGTGTSYFDEASIFNMTTVNNDAIKLYAQWTPITYYIEYNSNAASGNMEIQTLTYDKGSNLLENKFAKEGYMFVEWNTKADGTGTSYVDKQSVVNLTNINGEIITLYAQWIANNYQLKFDGNTGNGTMENQTLVYDKESTLIKNVYEKEGYIFNGWNTSTDGLGTSYTDEQSVINLTNINNEVITLYAIWTPITYEIKFDANTGIGTMQNQTLTYDESQPLQLNSYEKEGYVFKYWNTEKDGTGTKYSDGLEIINLTDKNNDVITLYAIWRVDTLFEIEEYVIEDDKYINKIAPNTLRDDFLEKIYVDNKYEVKVFNRNNTELLEDEYVYTGSITKIMQGDTVIEEFTNIILGDVNGDGQISISDVSKIHSHVEKTSIMIEDYYLNAADANRNADITVSDTSKVFSYVEKVITDLWR